MYMYMCMYPKLSININLINHIMIVLCQHIIITHVGLIWEVYNWKELKLNTLKKLQN